MAEGRAPIEIGVEHVGGVGIVFDRSRPPQAQAQWFDPAFWSANAVRERGGRGAVWFIRGPFGDAVLRHYRRGGLAGRLLDDQYLWLGAERTRSLAEFRLLSRLYAWQLPVPRPIAARWQRSGWTYRADLLTSEIPGARTLAELLPELADGERQHARLQSLGRTLARFHRVGVWHADLNAHNLLIDRDGQWHVIDFDRGCIRPPQTGWINASLMRLRRSIRKLSSPAVAEDIADEIRTAHAEALEAQYAE